MVTFYFKNHRVYLLITELGSDILKHKGTCLVSCSNKTSIIDVHKWLYDYSTLREWEENGGPPVKLGDGVQFEETLYRPALVSIKGGRGFVEGCKGIELDESQYYLLQLIIPELPDWSDLYQFHSRVAEFISEFPILPGVSLWGKVLGADKTRAGRCIVFSSIPFPVDIEVRKEDALDYVFCPRNYITEVEKVKIESWISKDCTPGIDIGLTASDVFGTDYFTEGLREITNSDMIFELGSNLPHLISTNFKYNRLCK